jgi:hypothetical protein
MEGIFLSLDQANALSGLLLAAVHRGAITQDALAPYAILINDPVITITPKAIQLSPVMEGTTLHLIALCDDGTIWDQYPDVTGASPTWHRISSPSTTTGMTFPLPGVELVQAVPVVVTTTQGLRWGFRLLQAASSTSTATQALRTQ